MSAQLELDLTRERRPSPGARAASALRAAGAAALAWAPVWAPLVLIAQIVGLGLLPARAQAGRLDAAEASVRARVTGLVEEERGLRAEQRMLADEVYRERVRRSLVDPGAEPLTLERARTGAEPRGDPGASPPGR